MPASFLQPASPPNDHACVLNSDSWLLEIALCMRQLDHLHLPTILAFLGATIMACKETMAAADFVILGPASVVLGLHGQCMPMRGHCKELTS